MIQPRPERSLRPPEGALIVPEPMLDACRRASLDLGGPKLTRVGVTSALRGEGRTSIALGLAVVQESDYDRSVLLVDLDLESAGLARAAGVNPWPGLSELARSEVSPEEVVQPVTDSISVVAAGVTEGNAPRVMGDILRLSLLDRLAGLADILVLDLPPVLGCTFGRAAAEPAPNLLLVVRGGVTPAARVREATGQLEREPAVLLNATETALPRWLRRLYAL